MKGLSRLNARMILNRTGHDMTEGSELTEWCDVIERSDVLKGVRLKGVM